MIRKNQSKSQKKNMTLDFLSNYLNRDNEEHIKFLCHFWENQQNAITYAELRGCILSGEISPEILNDWQQDYTKMISERFPEIWIHAMETATKDIVSIHGLGSVSLTISQEAILNWIADRAGSLVTNCVSTQRDAIKTLVLESYTGKYGTDELAKIIRPCIGLDKQQAAANLRYYDNIKENLLETHPRMKPENAEKKAREAAAKYAGKQHRYRADTIARTEMATAYNNGKDLSIRQAQKDGYMGKMLRRWCTSGDSNVCNLCRDLDNTTVNMNENFSITYGKKVIRTITVNVPPLHPRCACGLEYIEDD